MKNAVYNGIFVLLFLMTGILCAQAIEKEPVVPDVFRSHRTLFGLKLKVSDNFTIYGFRADYLGNGAQYKTAEDTDNYEWSGWDMVPGISFGLGELFAGIKLAVGGDFYFLFRLQAKGQEEYVEYRPRFNVFFTKALPFGGFVQWGQRFERRAQENYNYPVSCNKDPLTGIIDSSTCAEKRNLKKFNISYRYRSMFKIMAPSFTPVNIAPYAYSEAFNELETNFYSETEIGINIQPVKGLSISLADQIQLKYTEDRTITTHMICLYGFYTFDLSNLTGGNN